MARIRPITQVKSGPSIVSGTSVAPILGSGSPIPEAAGVIGSGIREIPGLGVLASAVSTVVGTSAPAQPVPDAIASTITVRDSGGDYTTIAAALAAATSGDVIGLEPSKEYTIDFSNNQEHISIPQGVTLQTDLNAAQLASNAGYAQWATIRTLNAVAGNEDGRAIQLDADNGRVRLLKVRDSGNLGVVIGFQSGGDDCIVEWMDIQHTNDNDPVRNQTNPAHVFIGWQALSNTVHRPIVRHIFTMGDYAKAVKIDQRKTGTGGYTVENITCVRSLDLCHLKWSTWTGATGGTFRRSIGMQGAAIRTDGRDVTYEDCVVDYSNDPASAILAVLVNDNDEGFNQIFDHCTLIGTSGQHTFEARGGPGHQLKNSIIYNPGGNYVAKYNGSVVTESDNAESTSLASYQFVDTANHNYRLQSGSPQKDNAGDGDDQGARFEDVWIGCGFIPTLVTTSPNGFSYTDAIFPNPYGMTA